MHETLSLALALMAGVVLGATFFGGLWWTVRKCISANQPGFWIIGSGFLRMTVVLAGFYLVAHAHWERLLICLLGFVMARVIVTRFTRAPQSPTYRAQEASRAPYS